MGRAGNRYCPLSLVIAVWTPISAGLDAVTVTPGSTAPVLSLTVPLIPPVVCADCGMRQKQRTHNGQDSYGDTPHTPASLNASHLQKHADLERLEHCESLPDDR